MQAKKNIAMNSPALNSAQRLILPSLLLALNITIPFQSSMQPDVHYLSFGQSNIKVVDIFENECTLH